MKVKARPVTLAVVYGCGHGGKEVRQHRPKKKKRRCELPGAVQGTTGLDTPLIVNLSHC